MDNSIRLVIGIQINLIMHDHNDYKNNRDLTVDSHLEVPMGIGEFFSDEVSMIARQMFNEALCDLTIATGEGATE